MAVLLAALLLAAADPPAKAADPAPLAGASAQPAKPADISKAVDADGVPAWAKRKQRAPVQNCTTRPNIGVETWRQEYEKDGKGRHRNVPPKATCK